MSLLSLAGISAAYSGPAPMARPAVQPAMVEKSAAIPFLKKPPALNGSMPGDVGFDPLGFTTTITELGGDLNYVREAELMHGRQAMLATVGFVFPTLVGNTPEKMAEMKLKELKNGRIAMIAITGFFFQEAV